MNEHEQTGLACRPRFAEVRFKEPDPFQAVALSYKTTLLEGVVRSVCLTKDGFKIDCLRSRMDLVRTIVDVHVADDQPRRKKQRSLGDAVLFAGSHRS